MEDQACVWRGEIARAPRGANGFGYDPLFYLPELGRTAAELDSATKNRISHRGQALVKLLTLHDEVAEPATGVREPGARGVHLITTAMCLAATPDVGAPDPAGA